VIVCPNCGEENPERARFCLACAEPLGAAATPVGEERKVVSVLFVDLVGFTDRSDRADPEDVRATLRPYHERVKADIERHGGTVEKFIGDAVMAVFGAPVAHEDDAERAVRSGLRILETIEDLRSEGLEVAVRAAVTTGEAVVALGARPERGEGMVAGDVVNTAARLQSAAAVGTVVVDETTMRSTDGSIDFEPLEPVVAKGKSEPIATWRAAGARSRVGQPEAATLTPFVGRAHERTLLLETFLRAERESAVQLVTVVGEPGIGKSRLVTELRSALDERSELITWRHGRCLPYGEGITFWALGEIVKAEAGILESDDRGEAASKLDATIAALVEDESERRWFAATLGPLVGAGGEGQAAGREEAFTAWRRFLESMAARRPTVLVVEDLHWADSALLDFLEHLLDWSTPVPLLLLCTARPELFERHASWGGGKRNATTISLAPLSNEDSARLLQTVLERAVLPAESQTVLLERAGGNPLYAEQFARMLVESGSPEELAVPETVHALVAARLDTLAPELKSLLQDASVVGRVFWTGAVASIGGRERDDVRRGLNELVRREFVRPVRLSSIEGEEELSFWHALVHDVAYAQIPRSPRADKHLAAAAWVERMAEGRVEDHAEILVHHLSEARALKEAAGEDVAEIDPALVRFLVLAGERAQNFDASAAEAYLRRAVELAEGDDRARGIALARLAVVQAFGGKPSEALETSALAVSILRQVDDREAALAMQEQARGLWAAGETARGHQLRLESISILERGKPGKELLDAYGGAAMNAAIADRLDETEVLLDKGQALSDALGEPSTSLIQARATFLWHRGDRACVEFLEAAREVALQQGVARFASVATNNLADAKLWYDGATPALDVWDEAIEFSRARGLEGLVMWQRGERVRALYHLGRWDDVVAEGDEVLRWLDERGARGQIQGIVGAPLAAVVVHRGSIAQAEADVEELLTTARASGDPQVLVPGLEVAALVASAAGRPEAVLEHVRELEDSTHASLVWRSTCLGWPVRLAVTYGEHELAEAFLEWSEHDSVWDRAARPAARAVLAEAGGRVDEAAALYRVAEERWAEYGSVVERAYALLGLARVAGDADAAREGAAIFESLGARPVSELAA
jgi:class 3 adenylate cyclase